MTTTKFLAAIAVLAIIFAITMFKEKEPVTLTEDDEELLRTPTETLETWDRKKLKRLLDYSREKEKSASNKKQAECWKELNRRAWTALYGHQL